ncbi:MAG: glycoside hydrolase family 127 protein [Candidatus Aminicenantales bacterium]
MKKRLLPVFVAGAALAASYFLMAADPAQQAEIIQAVPFTDVKIADGFWTPRIDVNRNVTIPYLYKKFNEGNRTETKTLEATFFELAKSPDPVLESLADGWLKKLLPAPAEDDSEERVYPPISLGSGHLYEAAATHFETTGRKEFLNKALASADSIVAAFGPDKRRDVPGHQGIEVGLVRLYRATGNQAYWKLAKFLLDERGSARTLNGRKLYGEYAQDHIPVVAQDTAVGHAVRAMFMYMGMADIAEINHDSAYLGALDKIWDDVTYRKLALTGGIGPRRLFEGFGEPYELPNLICWNETCASFGDALWNHRLFLHHGDAKYLDIMERTFYNGFLVGVSLSGDRFFYQNLLKSTGNFERSEWFGVPCCPPNVARLIASLGSYVYARSGDNLYINLFLGNQARIKLDHNVVDIRQETRYPWDGAVRMTVDPDSKAPFALLVRIPEWAQNRPLPGDLYSYVPVAETPVSLKVNGLPAELAIEKGFARIERTWAKGDVVELNLPMPVRRALSNENIKENRGRIALERGPIVYCAEWPDNGGKVLNLVVPDEAKLGAAFRKDLLGGVGVITGKVTALDRGNDKILIRRKVHNLTAIPYYAWANRGQGEMAVWLARDESKALPPPALTIASTSRVSSSENRMKAPTGSTPAPGIENLAAVNDQAEPVDIFDGSTPFLRLLPAEGSPAWIQYDFKKAERVSSAEVFWLDDHRFCRIPESWRLLYRDGEEWKPVANLGPYPVETEGPSRVGFTPVKTTGLRLEIQPAKQVYDNGIIGPPSGTSVQGGPLVWTECGVFEWSVR